tara:strand:+ start:132317 stop:132907 length:591 start_codon:yes stop_codon:yes gene_type:complete
MAWLEPTTLKGVHCTLMPLAQEHSDNLIEAGNDGKLWSLIYTSVAKPENMMADIEKRLAKQEQGNMLPFTVMDNASGKAIGMTSFYNIDEKNHRLDLGYTWYAKSYWGTPVNTECKFLLLEHAFETLDCICVTFKVDYLNKRSQRAVEKLGAKRDGLIRNFLRYPDGSTRDVVIYSILPHEWPRIKSLLNSRLSPY